jgi:hypothetical protein
MGHDGLCPAARPSSCDRSPAAAPPRYRQASPTNRWQWSRTSPILRRCSTSAPATRSPESCISRDPCPGHPAPTSPGLGRGRREHDRRVRRRRRWEPTRRGHAAADDLSPRDPSVMKIGEPLNDHLAGATGTDVVNYRISAIWARSAKPPTRSSPPLRSPMPPPAAPRRTSRRCACPHER